MDERPEPARLISRTYAIFFPLMLKYHVVRYLDTRQKVQEQYAGPYVTALKMLKVFLIVGQCAWIVELEDDVPF